MKHRFDAAAVPAFIYLIAALAWITCAELLIGVAETLDIIGPQDRGVIMGLQLVPLLGGTCLLIYRISFRYARRADLALRQLRLVGDAATNGIAVIDETGVVQTTNVTFRQLLNLSPLIEGASPIETLIGPYVTEHSGWMLPPVGEVQNLIRMRSGVGETSEVALRTRRFDENGCDSGWILTALNLTADQNETTTRRIRLRALEAATDGVAVADLEQPDSPLIYVNRAFRDMTGYSELELLGRNCRYLQGNDRQQPEVALVREAIRQHQPITVTFRNYRKDGVMFWNEMRLTPVSGDKGAVTHYVAIMRDVTEPRENALRLRRLMCFDQETSLYNRTYFVQLLAEMLDRAEAEILLLRLDIIGFNEIANCFGDAAGSDVLTEVGRRLAGVVPGSIVGLLGGNEFGVAVPVVATEQADRIAALRAAIAAAFHLSESRLQVFFSVGFAVGTRSTKATALLRYALSALTESKRTRVGVPRGYRSEADDEAGRRLRLTRDLQQAVTNGDFTLHFQPRVDLASSEIVGAEALIRWKHPVFGLQPPSRFIAAAETTTHIIAIDAWALREAAVAAARVNQSRARPLVFSVNLSAVHFQDANIVETLHNAIRGTCADPTWLTLEVAESVLSAGTPEVMTTLRALREIGFGISIDDFGTGCSNVGLLDELPATEIKIDPRFVRGIGSSRFKRSVVGGIVTMADALGWRVVAECIEADAEQRDLSALGVNSGYGYLFGAPVDLDGFSGLVGGVPAAPAGGNRPTAVMAA